MAGLALFIDHKDPPQTNVFCDFLGSVAAYKSLVEPALWSNGASCIAAKLDGPSSIHKGITQDGKTNSWLLAAGTVIDPENISPDGSLEKTLVDFLDQGEKVLSRLDGQFALIIYDARNDTTLAVTDPFGLIPFYYGQKGRQYYISTSALAVAKAIGGVPDDFGVRSFLLYGSTFGSTIWRNVHMLPPATFLKVGREGARRSSYWSFQIDPAIAALPLNESVDCMLESFSRSLRNSLGREGKVWVSLTGGMDSRALAALANYSQIPFKTYCHGPVDSKDVRIAAQISHKMGWEHEYFALPENWGTQRVSWFDGVLGQTDGHLDVIKMSRTLREQTIKAQQLGVSLWGYGGELFRGVYWKHEMWRTGVTPTVDYDRLLDYRVIPFNGAILKNEDHWKGTLREEIKHRLQRIGEQQPGWQNTVKLDLIGTALERHACGTTIASVLGWQRVILPFDFKENIARIFSINYKWRTHGRMFRLILERINPRLAEIETADGGPASPMRFNNLHRFLPYWLDTGEKLLWKLGYKATGKAIWKMKNAGPAGRAYPTGQWLQDTLTETSRQSLLAHDQMVSSFLYDQDHLQELVNSHKTSSLSGGTMLGHILALELALRSVANEI